MQQAIRPEAIALSVFAAVATAAMLVLVGQGLAQLVSRSAPDIAVMRALGASRAHIALAVGLPGVIAVLGGTVLAVAGAIALSPLAPVGPVRRYDPDHGIHGDWAIVGPGAALFIVVLLGLLAVLAARSARPRASQAQGRPSVIARAAVAAGLPPSAVVGTRNALEPGTGVRSVPVRSTLLGSITAVAAVVSAVVFGTSLTGLISHPVRYGWNWNVIIQAEGGYGSFSPAIVNRVMRGQPAVRAWSEFAFTQLSVDGHVLPVMGIQPRVGTVEPPTISGQPLHGPDQIELGAGTLAELGKKVGDTVRIGARPYTRTVRITGVVTLPSFGLATADHVSLGRGAMLPEATLLAAEGATGAQSGAESQPTLPSTIAIDLVPGTTAAQRAQLVHRIVAANPDQTPGGTYELRSALAAAIVNARQMGGQPIALALGLAAAAALVPGPDRPQLGAPTAPRTGPAQGAGHDPRPAPVGHRLADHADAADRGGDRRPARRGRGPAGLAELRRLAGGHAGQRDPGGRAHPRAARTGPGGQPALHRARGHRRPDPPRDRPARRIDGRRARDRPPFTYTAGLLIRARSAAASSRRRP